MNPNEQADKEAENRGEDLPKRTIRASNVIVGKRSQVHAHEGDERAKIQQFGPIVVCNEERAN